ncbi:hypothetical protein [Bufonid herpesvirus 1]|uniref:hypothetical protein n=1 Tax=Bufonid herpesvirus 1 TaxID=2282206 RepID=UPI000EB74546|nr:hypothetical protein [Bufonid herpesvirus 1]AXF48502.1 hypothetical protein [Bufonid herpesvirus 1]
MRGEYRYSRVLPRRVLFNEDVTDIMVEHDLRLPYSTLCVIFVLFGTIVIMGVVWGADVNIRTHSLATCAANLITCKQDKENATRVLQTYEKKIQQFKENYTLVLKKCDMEKKSMLAELGNCISKQRTCAAASETCEADKKVCVAEQTKCLHDTQTAIAKTEENIKRRIMCTKGWVGPLCNI